MSQKCCIGCVGEWIKQNPLPAKAAKVAKRADREKTKARREAIKTIRDFLKDAQAVFNRYIRLRDAGHPCISCGLPMSSEAVGGGYDAGHYRSVGAAGHLRFDEQNVHAQCKRCNRYGAGRVQDYRIGLIARIGLPAVERIEADNSTHKWTRDELIRIIETYRQKCRELEG